MLWTLGRHAIAALLGKRFLGQIFRNFHTFDLHANIIQKFRVGMYFTHEQFLHVMYALTHNHAKAFTARHLMEKFQCRRTIAKVQFHAACLRFGENTFFITFHHEGHTVGK